MSVCTNANIPKMILQIDVKPPATKPTIMPKDNVEDCCSWCSNGADGKISGGGYFHVLSATKKCYCYPEVISKSSHETARVGTPGVLGGWTDKCRKPN